MKQVFRCDYCSYIDTEEEVVKHEKTCLGNPEVKCCDNCKYAFENNLMCSSFLGNKVEMLECRYKEQETNGQNFTDSFVLRKPAPIPESRICEHYERGKPGRIIGL